MTVSKATTHIDKPLRADGYPDYLAALNRIASAGVTPDNNAAAIIARALGPAIVDVKDRKMFFQRLGIDLPSEQGDYFVDYFDYVRQYAPEEDEYYEKDGESFCPAYDQYDRASQGPWSREDCPLVASWLASNEKALALATEASEQTRYYVPAISHGDPAMEHYLTPTFCNEVYSVRYIVRALRARVMLRLHEDDIAKAWADIQTCHRLARLVGQGKTSFEGMVAHALAGIACDSQQRVGHFARLTPRKVREFVADVNRLPPLPSATEQFCLDGRFTYLDLVCFTARHGLAMDMLEKDPEIRPCLERIGLVVQKRENLEEQVLRKRLPDWVSSARVDWDEVLRLGNAYFDRIAEAGNLPNLRDRQKAGDAVELDREISWIATIKALESSGGAPSREIVSRQFALAYLDEARFTGTVIWQQLGNRAVINGLLTELALALGGFRTEHGRYPDELGQLVPKYVPRLPNDPLGNGGFRYRRVEDGYILYSVGPNGHDDGGPRPESSNTEEDDPLEGSDDLGIRREPSHGWPKRLDSTSPLQESLPGTFQNHSGLVIGKQVLDFTITVLEPDGRTKTLTRADLAGKTVVIKVWKSDPAPPQMKQLVERYEKTEGSLAILFIGVSGRAKAFGDICAQARLLGKKHVLVAADQENSALQAFGLLGAAKMDVVFVLDGKGLVQGVEFIGQDQPLPAELTRLIDSLLEQKPPVP